jgi:hypothetical protein
MSIFANLFGSAPATPAPAAAPPQQPQQPTQAQPGNIPDPALPPQTPEAPEASPLDQFKDLWQPSDNQTNSNAPLLNVDPKKLAEAARKTDFAKMINPQMFEKIQAGGPEAAQAFAQAMNQVAQGVYAQSAFASSKIVEAAVAKAREQMLAEMPAQFKSQQVSESLRTENPALSHPAAQPIISAVKAQLQTKFPSASASELTAMAKQYLQNFASAAAPQPKAAVDSKSKDTDWSLFETN